MTRPRNAPTTIDNLTAAAELACRIGHTPPDAYRALLALDAGILAEGRRLPGLFVSAALHAEQYGMRNRAVQKIGDAQRARKARGQLPPAIVPGGRLPV